MTRLSQGVGMAALLVVLAQPTLVRADMVRVGGSAPRLMLRELDGRVFSLSDVAYPGTPRRGRPRMPVLLDFFRTDCPPCRRKLPEVMDLHRTFQARGLTVVLVALLEPEDGEQKLRQYLDQNPIPFPVLVDRFEDTARRFIHDGQSLVLGTMVLVDRQGIVRAVDQSLEPNLLPALEAAVVPPPESGARAR